MFVANDLQDFKHLFITRLIDMLSAEELGAFILVLANSLQDKATSAELRAELRRVYDAHKKMSSAERLQEAVDDVTVFEKLLHVGIDSLSVWRCVEKGEWLQIYNPMRALRPPRASSDSVVDLRKPFDANGFNFNKPFLKAEILWQGKISNGDHHCDCMVLFNKFPFMPYHFILVPQAEAGHAQYLTSEYHRLVWSICAQNADVLSGVGFGYNSIGACASVNHLHFQGFIYEAKLPVELESWQHNGGDSAYPMRCDVYHDVERCWQAIQRLHDNNQAYNLLYRAGCCYVLQRRMQGHSEVRERVVGAGWIEACGVFSEAAEAAITDLSADDLRADIGSLSV